MTYDLWREQFLPGEGLRLSLSLGTGSLAVRLVLALPLTGIHPVGLSLSFFVSLCSHLGQDVRSCFLLILSCGWYKGDMGSRVEMGLWELFVGLGHRCAGPGCGGTRGG